MQYSKPWLSVADQVDKLEARGLLVPDRRYAAAILREVGYYRLTGYLHPFRRVDALRDRVRSDDYLPGTRIEDAAALIDFDRGLRLLALEGMERIEIAVRTQVGHVLGRAAPFGHLDGTVFTDSFLHRPPGGPEDDPQSRHEQWLARVSRRQRGSDEAFVAHFRSEYDDRMPIWALTEILELGQVVRLYSGLRNDLATDIAHGFGVPSKRVMQSWLASVNYVRNVAAHHGRLFNRKLVVAPKRSPAGAIPVLAHLSATAAPKEFGVYSALAVMAFLVRSVPDDNGWTVRMRDHLQSLPRVPPVTLGSMGAFAEWLDEPLWQTEGP